MKLIRFVSFVIALILPAIAAQAQDSYKVRSGDALAIEVLEDPSLNRAVVVLPDGRFSFPFAGTLVAAGQTVGEIETAIRTAIAGNFASPPTVFVAVQPAERRATGGGGARAPRTIDIYFLGEIATPGLAKVERGTTLLQAIAVSGGFSKFAATKRVQLRRTDKRTGQQVVRQINYKALVDGAAPTTDIELKDGDVILVPERRLFE